jgi:hypothetical protein
MTPLKRLHFRCTEVSAQFACDRPREKAAAHSNPAMDEPAFDDHSCFRQCLLPREHMGVYGIDECAVQIKDDCLHDLLL